MVVSRGAWWICWAVCGCGAPAGGSGGEGGSSTTDAITTTTSTATTATDTSSSSESGSSGSGSESDSGTTGDPAPSDPGCPECIVLVDGLVGGRGVAVDGTSVYFTDESQGTVHAILKGGGDGTVLADAQDHPYDIVSDGDYVYWTNFAASGSVMRVPKAGGDPELVGAGGGSRSLTVADGYVYWSTFGSGDGDVWRRSIALEGRQQRISSVLGGVPDLVVHDDFVYFTAHAIVAGGFIVDPTPGPPVGSIFRAPIERRDPLDDTSILIPDLAEPWGLALSGSTLVWAQGDSDGSVASCDSVVAHELGQPGTQVLAGSGNAPWGVAADATRVYWTDADRVLAVGIDGSAEVVLADQQANARFIAVDSDNVYWITRTRLLQRPKP